MTKKYWHWKEAQNTPCAAQGLISYRCKIERTGGWVMIGMICVLARDLEEALKLIREKCDYCFNSFPADQYKVIENPEAFLCWGGG